ncbi:2-phospho-L-lactate guanylyltransferase [bioreactor metagenome]|uniref:2-phospho-L-lactate guanylyltransferase n=1 Tax=bioreactor metagenome TaxID=1076179 RepID=A0A644TPX3_9ZZZZ|nr:nucleotidyltransferase family protein [Negativicutes bacterium]
MYDAIILAGGENSKDLSKFSPQPYEAMIEIAGKPMVSFVAQALSASQHVDKIYVVGPVKELERCEFPGGVVIVEGGSTIIDTIRRGMEALGHERKVLVVTADIPLLTPEAVNDFLMQCDKVEADLYYPIVRREVNNKCYPGNKRTYVRLKEGTYTGGNIFLVNPAIVPQCMALAARIIGNRKNPFKLVCILGWKFVLRFVLGILSLGRVEKRVSELLGITGAVVHSQYPELGIDVDKPSDLELVKSTFSAQC